MTAPTPRRLLLRVLLVVAVSSTLPGSARGCLFVHHDSRKGCFRRFDNNINRRRRLNRVVAPADTARAILVQRSAEKSGRRRRSALTAEPSGPAEGDRIAGEELGEEEGEESSATSSTIKSGKDSVRDSFTEGRLTSRRQGSDGAGGGGGVPTYDGMALAREVFANPCFYYDQRIVADLRREMREAVFGEGTTIDQVREAYANKPDGDGFLELAIAIGANVVPVKAYFVDAVSVELLLADKRFVVIGIPNEVDHYTRIGAVDVPTLDTIFNQYQAPQGGSPEQRVESRDAQLCMVTGSSGSGKTFFCLHYLTRFLRNKDDLSVAVYLHPTCLDTSFAAGGTGAPLLETGVGSCLGQEVVRLVRDKVGAELKRRVTSKLKMHVCLIFDEAGALGLKGLFEKRTVLQSIYAYVKDHLADNVVMVVSGTGITGSELESKEDAYFFRLKPWDPKDLEKLLVPHAGKLNLKKGDDLRTVVDAIVAQPKLRALITNARAAYFLVNATVNMCSVYVGDSWSVQIDAWAPALVTRVVHGYMATNGIRSLSPEQRALVAACVFRALKDARSQGVNLPVFPILDDREKAVAIALLTYNVELVSKGTETTLLEKDKFAVYVTPAIAVVLFTMSGLQVSMIPGWRAEEELAGLHAARRLILDRLDSHIASSGNSKVTELMRDLGGIRLLSLRKQIRAPVRLRKRTRALDEGDIWVPLVPPMSVLLNGEKSSFADVIAPFMLLQAKHTSDGTVRVNIEDELRKCCLLNDGKDDRVLRGVLAVWRGSFRFEKERVPEEVGLANQTSSAYLENLVKYGTPIDPVAYAQIRSFESKASWEGGNVLTLPQFQNNESITFVLVSNAEVIHLRPLGLNIKESDLDKQCRLDTSKLRAAQKAQWEVFLGRVKPWVSIEFVFTNSQA